MRSKLFILLLTGLLIHLFAFALLSQEEQSKGQLYVIHEDIVKPSMVSKYEEAEKALIAKLKEHNLAGPSYLTVDSGDFHYSYVTKVDNMAALDKDFFKELADKIGDDQMKAMWDRWDDTIESHKTYMLRLLPDLSYNPSVATMSSEETPFRHLDYWYFQPGKGDEVKEIAKEWKALYESKKVETGYRLYRGELGTERPFYVVVNWAKNAAEFYSQAEKNEKVLGEERKALIQKTLAVTKKFEHKNGRIRPDLSYFPAEGTN